MSPTVGLIVVFGIGSVAVIASIVRINALYIFQHSKDIPCEPCLSRNLARLLLYGTNL